jgi:hypothetical protein
MLITKQLFERQAMATFPVRYRSCTVHNYRTLEEFEGLFRTAFRRSLASRFGQDVGQMFFRTGLNLAELYHGPDRQNLIDELNLALRNLAHSD